MAWSRNVAMYPWKFNITPEKENIPKGKERSLLSIIFSGTMSMSNFRGVHSLKLRAKKHEHLPETQKETIVCFEPLLFRGELSVLVKKNLWSRETPVGIFMFCGQFSSDFGGKGTRKNVHFLSKKKYIFTASYIDIIYR